MADVLEANLREVEANNNTPAEDVQTMKDIVITKDNSESMSSEN